MKNMFIHSSLNLRSTHFQLSFIILKHIFHQIFLFSDHGQTLLKSLNRLIYWICFSFIGICSWCLVLEKMIPIEITVERWSFSLKNALLELNDSRGFPRSSSTYCNPGKNNSVRTIRSFTLKWRVNVCSTKEK